MARSGSFENLFVLSRGNVLPTNRKSSIKSIAMPSAAYSIRISIRLIPNPLSSWVCSELGRPILKDPDMPITDRSDTQNATTAAAFPSNSDILFRTLRIATKRITRIAARATSGTSCEKTNVVNP